MHVSQQTAPLHGHGVSPTKVPLFNTDPSSKSYNIVPGAKDSKQAKIFRRYISLLGHDPEAYYEKQQEILASLNISPPPGASYQEKLSLHLHHKLTDKLEANTKLFNELAEYHAYFNKLEQDQMLGIRRKNNTI